MNKVYLITLIVAFFIGCTSREKDNAILAGKANESIMSNDNIGNLSISSLKDSGLIISASKYKVTSNTNRYYKKINIPIKICATIEPNGFGNIDSILLFFDGIMHNLRTVECFIESPQEIIAIKNWVNYGIRLNDYNFDNKPDIAIYNSASGMKNIIEDIFIYNKTKRSFVYNKILSESSNCTVDTINKHIVTFGQGGMASMIYNSETYKWEGEKLKMIKAIRQNYNNELNQFIKETKELIDTNWLTSIDTLTEERILEMREGK